MKQRSCGTPFYFAPVHCRSRETGAKEFHVTGSAPVQSKMEFRNERCFMGKALYPPEFSLKVTNPDKIRTYCGILAGSN